MVEIATDSLKYKGFDIQTTTMQNDDNVDEEIEKHRWADVHILQTPCNWMGVPWTFKKNIWIRFTPLEWMAGYVLETVVAVRINRNSMDYQRRLLAPSVAGRVMARSENETAKI